MDKTWIYADRRSKKYQLGVSNFLQFALENARNVDLLCCPCLDCGNTKSFSSSIINEHLYFHGFDSSYQNWIWHGEAARLDDSELTETDLEATFISDEGDGEADVEIVGDMDSEVDFSGDEEFSKDSDEFREFVEDGCNPMYPGCTKFSKLNALVRIATSKTSPTKATRIAASVAQINPSVVKNVKNKSTGSKRKAKSRKEDDIVCSGSSTPAVQTDGLSTPAGLKLMKRGYTTMMRVNKRVAKGKKRIIRFNLNGIPCGPAAKEMQSYIGVLARTKIPIVYKCWKDKKDKGSVDRLADLKNKIWEAVELAYVLCPENKKMVISSASHKWRNFKSLLSTKYIIPYLDDPERIKTKPADFNYILQEDWDIFVASRLDPAFLELRKAQQEKRALNKYDHRLSRKGYAGLEYELSQEMPDTVFDRADLWVKARVDKNGGFKDPAVEEKAKKIEKLKERASSGDLQIAGTTDVLTLALETPEHPGRVRGIGGFAKPSAFFNLPKRRKESLEAQVRVSVKNIWKEHEEAAKNEWILEERARTDALISELHAKIEAAGLNKKCSDKASPKTPVGYETQGSCSHPVKKDLDPDKSVGDMEKGAAVKKVLNLDVHKEVKEMENVENHEVEDMGKMASVENYEVDVVEDMEKMEKDNEGEMCKLVLRTSGGVVAHAKVIIINSALPPVLHGKPLRNDCDRVCICKAIDPEAKIPFPIGDEIVTVEDAIDSMVAWPKKYVIPFNYEKRSNPNLETTKKRKIEVEYPPEFNLKLLPSTIPVSLKMLCRWAKDQMKGGKVVKFEVGNVFGSPSQTFLEQEDIFSFATMKEISNGCILLYMSFLHDILEKVHMLEMIKFVSPVQTGSQSCGNASIRSRAIADSFNDASENQIFLIPQNTNKHWTLTVVCPTKEVVSFMNPLDRSMPGVEWKTIVDNAIHMWKAKFSLKRRKKAIRWNCMAGVPVQPGSTECEYYVMRYMRDICNDKELRFDKKWAAKTNLVYSEAEINEVRSEWANWVSVNLLDDDE